jgi:prepilin-type processing-associated H-X9-DG protein
MTMLSWQAHDGKANIGLADGHVTITKSTLYNRIGPPRNRLEFSYY